MARVTIPYKPRYPEVHRNLDSRRFCVLVAHRRFGKTVLAVNHLIKAAIACPRAAGHFAYVAPFRNQAKSVAWDYLKHYTAVIPGARRNESDLSVSLPSAGGGARVRIFGADNPDALRGLYFDGVVMDEVAQMKPDVWEEIVQPALADRQGFALFIGTPKGVNLFSRLYYHALAEEAKGNPEWAAMSFPVDATQALPGKEVERLREELSENKFRQEMLCDFTASADDSLILLDQVDAAMKRAGDDELAARWPLVVGVDVARFGDDATVFFRRRGLMAYEPVIIRKRSNTDVAQMLIAYIAEHQPLFVNIDQGQGTGVIDIVRSVSQSRKTTIVEVPFGSRANNETKFVNRRAEMWDAIRQWLAAGGCLPRKGAAAELLRAELTAPTYSFDAAGRIRLEAKEEIRKRLNHSTDVGDALALTFAIDVAPEETILPPAVDRFGKIRARKQRKLYDPFR